MNRALSPFLFFLLVPAGVILAGTGDTAKPLPRIDTNYIAEYPDRLGLGLFQSAAHYDILMEQFVNPDTSKNKRTNANYFADASNTSGISFDYDIIGFSLDYKSVSAYPERKVGHTDYYSYGLSFTTKGLRIENSIKKYKGFYDKHSPAYDSVFTDTGVYYKNPSMSVFTYKSKFIYTFKKRKFALGSAYANTSRQLRSAFTWMLIGDIYGLQMHADSSLEPRPIQTDYGATWNDMNNLKVIGLSGGGGCSGTLVLWKKIYVNFLAGIGIEAQHRNYSTMSGDGSLGVWQPSIASDWRASIGYNGKKFFIRLDNIIDYNYFYTSAIHIAQKFYSGEFTFGYRFKVKTPKLYRKFQQTKIYGYF